MTISLTIGAISMAAAEHSARRIDHVLHRRAHGDASAQQRAARSHWVVADQSQQRISLLRFTNMLTTIAEESGHPELGLELAACEPQHTSSPLGDLFAFAPTVGAVLEGLTHYLPMVQTETTVRLTREGSTVRFIYDIEDRTVQHRLHDASYTIGRLFRALHHRLGGNCELSQVTMSMKAPPSFASYTSFFEAPVSFGAQATALCFPAAFLDKPLPSANAERYAGFCQSMERLAASANETGMLADALRAWLMRSLHRGDARLEQVAADFGVTSRTLQRRLKESGIGFADLREGVRMELAHRMLRDTALPVTQIATLLGYSEISAFTRAFRCHARQSPRAFRSTTRTPHWSHSGVGMCRTCAGPGLTSPMRCSHPSC